MSLVDTHCHIQSIGQSVHDHTSELWAKMGYSAEEIISRAKENGVNKLICVGCDLEDSTIAVEFAHSRQNCYSSLGIHPHEAARYLNETEVKDTFRSLAAKPKVVALGECGLDYFYGHSSPKDQKRLLNWQLELASELDLPVIFHVRDAFRDFWPIFDRYQGKIRGVLHSFTDDSGNLKLALERGLYLGVNGIATFTKEKKQQDMFKAIPLERLLLETDAPYLTPTPYRGTINEPKQIRRIAEFVSGQRGISLDDLAETTTRNAHLLFRL